MKGVVLAGGLGTRMGICSKAVNKHCNLIYKYPMIVYPLLNLRSCGILDVMIVVSDQSAGQFMQILGNGGELGMNIYYGFQRGAGGIADALRVCRKWVGADPIVVLLGDNFFHPAPIDIVSSWGKEGAGVILYPTTTPEQFGVAVFQYPYEYINPGAVYYTIGHIKHTVTLEDFLATTPMINILEKPKTYHGNLMVTGMYMYDSEVWEIIESNKKSDRGELEITDVNSKYLELGKLRSSIYSGMWIDAGTPDKLLDASIYVRGLDNGDSQIMW
jgi:glucose-1-phosphate thymidylyltransferase